MLCSHYVNWLQSCLSPQYVEYKVFNLMADYYQLKCLAFNSITHFRRVASIQYFRPQPQTSNGEKKVNIENPEIFLDSNIFLGYNCNGRRGPDVREDLQ